MVKAMHSVKDYGHVAGLATNRFISFSFLINRPCHSCDTAIKKKWPWKSEVKDMAKVKPDGHIWGLNFNQYVCFGFDANGPFLVKMLTIPYLTLMI